MMRSGAGRCGDGASDGRNLGVGVESWGSRPANAQRLSLRPAFGSWACPWHPSVEILPTGCPRLGGIWGLAWNLGVHGPPMPSACPNPQRLGPGQVRGTHPWRPRPPGAPDWAESGGRRRIRGFTTRQLQAPVPTPSVWVLGRSVAPIRGDLAHRGAIGRNLGVGVESGGSRPANPQRLSQPPASGSTATTAPTPGSPPL